MRRSIEKRPGSRCAAGAAIAWLGLALPAAGEPRFTDVTLESGLITGIGRVMAKVNVIVPLDKTLPSGPTREHWVKLYSTAPKGDSSPAPALGKRHSEPSGQSGAVKSGGPCCPITVPSIGTSAAAAAGTVNARTSIATATNTRKSLMIGLPSLSRLPTRQPDASRHIPSGLSAAHRRFKSRRSLPGPPVSERRAIRLRSSQLRRRHIPAR